MDVEDLFAEYRIRCRLLGRALNRTELLADHPEHAERLGVLFDAWRQPNAEPEPTGTPVSSIGPYRILEILGQGGMGTVYRAEQTNPIRRQVAVKVVKLGMDSQAVLRRFEQERQALSVMNHDAIAKVFDTGITASGQPYFAMECVEGIPLTRYCDLHRLSIHDRIRLFQRVCQGVQHAHQKGVIHRDLKPGNILVAHQEGRHAPKIIDFGLARATERDLLEHTELTEHGALLGTPEYMSPEQTFGDRSGIDTRTDVYSLGVVLYELLTGRLPFSSAELRQGNVTGIQAYLQGKEPPRPSTRVSTQGDGSAAEARNRRSTARQLQRTLRGDLDWIVLRAMEKDRERRYGSATELAADLERYLESEPVIAGPPRASYRLQRFLRRNRIAVSTGSFVFFAIIVGMIATLWQARRAESNAATARENERRAEENLRDLLDLSTIRILDDLKRRANEDLWPSHPRNIEAMSAWIEDADAMKASLVELEAKLEAIRSQSLPWTSEQRRHDRETHASFSELKKEEEHRARHEPDHPASEKENAPYSAESLRVHLEELDANLVRLRSAVATRRTYEFAEGPELTATQMKWRHELLADLVAQMRSFVDGPEVPAGVDGTYGPSLPEVRRRLAFAQSLDERIPLDAARWKEVEADIAGDVRYAGIRLPIAGLVPLDKNPRTNLWEFWHVQSGAAPEPNAEWFWRGEEPAWGTTVESPNRWVVREETGLVLVLVPGGTFLMGSQKDDPGRANFDARTLENNMSVKRVSLDPFLISKFEVTQAQWQRMRGENPSLYSSGFDGTIGLTNPVEQVSWDQCQELVLRWGLVLPTEAQWEYACRGGRLEYSAWSSGDEMSTLEGLANLGDASFLRVGGDLLGGVPWDDSFPLHAPVGSLRPNAFGLHDMHGNLWEFCRDAYADSSVEPEPGDGLRRRPGARECVIRGGGFNSTASLARSASRYRTLRTDFNLAKGLRPALQAVAK